MTEKRNLEKELLESIADIKAGKGNRLKISEAPNVAFLRNNLLLTQLEMAVALGVSQRTLQEWEQGRRTPSGPAKALLHVMQTHPEIFLHTQ